MWWSGTSVSARRPWPGPASRTRAPVSAIARRQPVTTLSIFPHSRRHVSVLHSEGAAEAAALLGAGQLDQLQTPDRTKQRQRALAQAQHPQAVAGRMVGHPVREVGANIGHAEHIHDKFSQLQHPRRQRIRSLGQLTAAPLCQSLGADARIVVRTVAIAARGSTASLTQVAKRATCTTAVLLTGVYSRPRRAAVSRQDRCGPEGVYRRSG